MEREPIDAAPSVPDGDRHRRETGLQSDVDREGDRRIGPAHDLLGLGVPWSTGIDRHLPGPLCCPETDPLDGDLAGWAGVGILQVGLRHREDLRGVTARVATHRVGDRRPRCGRHDTDLGRSRVGDRVQPRPSLEVRRNSAVARVVVGVDLAGLPGVVADEAVHPRTRACRQWAVVRRRGRLERLVHPVVVGLDRVDQASGPVVDAHRYAGKRLRLAVADLGLVVGQAQVVDGEAPEVGGQRYRGEQVEVRCGGLAGTDSDHPAIAERSGIALEGAATCRDERRVRHVHRVVRAGAVIPFPCALGRRTTGGGRGRVRRVAGERRRRREVLLGQKAVTIEDVDVFFLGDLIHRPAVDRVLRDVHADQVLTVGQRLVGDAEVGEFGVERDGGASRVGARGVQVDRGRGETVVAVHGLAEAGRPGLARPDLPTGHR